MQRHQALRNDVTPLTLRHPSQRVKFLIVDDDLISVMSIKRQMRLKGIENPTTIARDGIEALEVLRGDCGIDQLLQPYVVLLDLNMPRMGGLEFLAAVRADPELRPIMIFVMTTSDAHQDVRQAYDKNVAGYFLKDHASGSFAEVLAMLEDFTDKVLLPS